MGYSLHHKGYKCLDLHNNRLYISRHVLFNEQHFPFSSSNKPPAHSTHLTPCHTLAATPPTLSPTITVAHNNTYDNNTFSPTITVPHNNTFSHLKIPTINQSSHPTLSPTTMVPPRNNVPHREIPTLHHNSNNYSTNPTTHLDSSATHFLVDHNMTNTSLPSTSTPPRGPTNEKAPPPTLNHHPMTTRAKEGIHKPKSLLAQPNSITVNEALRDEN